MQLSDWIDATRHRQFVGRREPLARFEAALAGKSQHRVFFVHGEGGIGKSTLLHELRRRATRASRPVVYLDAQEIDPTRTAMEAALAEVGHPSVVLLLDSYELLVGLDDWIRRELLPRRPADALTVLAGRDAPSSSWRSAPGWSSVLAVCHLDSLSPMESAELLARAGVPAGLQPSLVAMAHGHPLALAMLADVVSGGSVPSSLAEAPDLVAALLEVVVSEAPGPAHLTGLATCVRGWSTTEDLLRRTVGEDAPAVWDWLQRRPFVTRTPRGLVLHDLATEVLDAELERRSPERYRALHHIIHDWVVERIRTAPDPMRQHSMQQLLLLHRKSPWTAMFWELRSQGVAVSRATTAEHPQVISLVERFEGPASAALAARWLTELPAGLQVVHGVSGEISGFAYNLMQPTGSPLHRTDPVVAAIEDHVAAVAPTRTGERIHICRFIGGATQYQRDAHAVLAGSVSTTLDWLKNSLAYSFVCTIDPEFWDPFFGYLAFDRALDLAPEGLPRVVVYGHDWRRFSVEDWLELMNERETVGGTGLPPAELVRPAPLGREQFAEAVRGALRDLHNDERLAHNPLAGSALGAWPASGPAPAGIRRALLNGIERLAAQPREAPLARVLERTYVRPAPSQEAAAHILGLPFSTYRRHLARATAELVELLWSIEVGGAAGQRSSTD